MRMWGSHISSEKFTYTQLGSLGAELEDAPGKYFKAGVSSDSFCADMKTWSCVFNSLGNWLNLNVVLTLASNLETFIASLVRLALDSDPAVLLGTPHKIDGAYRLKYGLSGAIRQSDYIVACTKGTWGSRLGAIEKIFGNCPSGLRDVHSELEELRAVRNRVGHAFGRDIEDARRTGTLAVVPIEKMTRERVERLRRCVLDGARALDQHLIDNHIGDYEAVLFCSSIYPGTDQRENREIRAAKLKKAIGGHGAQSRGKDYCKGLIQYWDAL
jgi:hypothetical protein